MNKDPQHSCNELGEAFVIVLRQAMVVSSEMELVPLTQWLQRQVVEHNINEDQRGPAGCKLLIPLLFLGGAEHRIITDRLAMQYNTGVSIGDLLGDDRPYAVILLPDDFFVGIDKSIPPDVFDDDA